MLGCWNEQMQAASRQGIDAMLDLREFILDRGAHSETADMSRSKTSR
jgi:hypothetical protein